MEVERKKKTMMMVFYLYLDDDDSKDLAVIENQATGAPQKNKDESNKKVTIINFVRKTAQVSMLESQKPNENSSTRKETKKSSQGPPRKNKSALIKRPPTIRQERNDITSKSAEHSFKSRTERTVQRSVHSTAFKSIATGSFTLEESVPEDLHPLPPPVLLTKKPRRERSIFEDEASSQESKKETIMGEIRPREAIEEESTKIDERKSTKEKRTTKIRLETMKEGGRKKLTDIEEVLSNNIGE